MTIPSQAHVKKQALYFGCRDRVGHYLNRLDGYNTLYPKHDFPTIPWDIGLMDGTLLKNGKHKDINDGRVWWTCGGATEFWYAFFWWDNSVDRRGASNSGFYVRGFNWPEIQQAFDFACAEWPKIVTRQRFPLMLQSPFPRNAGSAPA